MRYGKIALIAAIFVFTLAISLHAGGNRERDEGQANTHTVALATMPTNLDPQMTNNLHSSMVQEHIFNQLVAVDSEMNTVPALAENWVWDEPTRLRIFLRRGVRFHNGDEMKASDVKFSLDRARASPFVGFMVNMIQSVETVNDREVLINLDYPFEPLVSHLAHMGTSIVSERAVRELGGVGHSLTPVGTGPYKVANIVLGDLIELTRWNNYWGTPPGTQNLAFRINDLCCRP